MISTACLGYFSLVLISLISLTSLNVQAGSTAIRQSKSSRYNLSIPNYDSDFYPYRSNDRLRKRATDEQQKFVCYYDSKAAARSEKGKLTPDGLDPHLCTHIIYCCASITNQFDISVADVGILRLFTDLKSEKINNFKTLINVHDTSKLFGDMILSKESRDTFSRNSLNFIERNNIDGIDLTWKLPKNYNQDPEVKKNFARLLSKLRKSLGPKNKLLSVTGPNEQKEIDTLYDVPKVDKYVDFINLQTYDYNVYKDDETGLHSPLYESSKYDLDESDRELNVNWTVNYWLRAGASKEKLLLGIATSGRSLSLKKASRNQIDDPTSGPGQQGQYTKTLWLLGYFEICSIFAANPRAWNYVRVKEYEVPYAHKGNQWICYEDMESVAVKARYATKMGLAGVSINSLDLDDFSGECHNQKFPLTRMIKSQLGSSTSSSTISSEEGGTTASSSTSTTTSMPTTRTTRIPLRSDQTPTMNQPSNPEDPNRKPLICYYENLAATRPGAGSLEVRKIDPFACTHIVYSYLGLSDDKKLKSIDEEVDLEKDDGFNGLRELSLLKKSNSRLKILIAIGGSGQGIGPYFEMAAEAQHRATFIESVMRFLDEYKLDGLSIDLEWPITGFDENFSAESARQNYVFLLRELKATFKHKGYLLMAAVSAEKDIIDIAYNIPQMSSSLDFINIRCFEYVRTKTMKTAIISPLFHSKKYDLSERATRTNANWSINYWIEKGAEINKITLGLPLHGTTYTLAHGAENEVNADAHGGRPGTYTTISSFWAYFEACFEFREKKGWTFERVNDYKSPYAYRIDTWVSYEDMGSVKEKANYVNNVELAGVSVFSLDKDDFLGVCHKMKYPLIKTIKSVLAGQQVTLQLTPIPTVPPTVTKAPKLTTSGTPRPTKKASIPTSTVTKPTPKVTTVPPTKPTTSNTPAVTQTPYTVTEEETTTTTTTTATNLPDDVPLCGTDGKWWFEGSNCNEYYDCTSGTPNLRVCPSGQAWKQEKLWCDFPRHKPVVECDV